jgi:CelD/BcsL family acetyltransferase involved in cellulose biosynthesis
MNLTLREARPATAAEWDAVWTACPYATYFHSRAWSEDWSTYTRGSLVPAPELVTFSDERRALLPITRQLRRRGLAVRNILSPAGTYGGWLADEPLETAHAQLLTAWLLAKRVPLWWRVNPFDPLAAVPAQEATEPDVTHLLPVERDAEGRCENVTHSQRSAVNKARRAGLVVRHATSAADWEVYFSIYENTLARWGDTASSRYGAELFELLRRRGEPGVTLWLTELQDGPIVAGAITLSAPHHVAGWHMATLADYFRLKPNNLMVHEIAEDACQRSLSWFDMNPSGGHKGVQEFKERCGGQPLACPVIVKDTPWTRAVAAAGAVAARLRGVNGGEAREPDGSGEAAGD